VPHFDTLILGAGAAGLFCGAKVAARGRRVMILDHARKPAEKIRISGGGRCNFTHLDTRPEAFISDNRHFAKSALARFKPTDFCQLMNQHGLSWEEKAAGQLFCEQKSGAIIQMLLDELAAYGGHLQLSTHITDVRHTGQHYQIDTDSACFTAQSLVIATGGRSVPKMGASGLAYDLAQQFGHSIVPTRPALVPFTFSGVYKELFSDLSGVSAPVLARAETGPDFQDQILFTHRGLSGPAILQISSYWKETEPITLNLLPELQAEAVLKNARTDQPNRPVRQALSAHLPLRLTEKLSQITRLPFDQRLGEVSNKRLSHMSSGLHDLSLLPTGTEGWRTAEVTAGGVATQALSSSSMESRLQPGLFFIGECVDVTGWLGGYNFQWAWASGAAAGAVA